MTDQHPITPPPELVEQWRQETCPFFHLGGINDLAIKAAQWGADQELEACGRWLEDQLCIPPDARADVITQLNGSRRPKPPSLKEQALHELNDVYNRDKIDDSTYDTICRALEALDD